MALKGQNEIILISDVGDLFVLGKKSLFRRKRPVFWLNTRTGTLRKVADSHEHFEMLLKNTENFESLFLVSIVEQLRIRGMEIQANEVYSCKILPVLGGKITFENFEPVDISVHFAFTDQIHEQIKDLPEGTKINSVKFER